MLRKISPSMIVSLTALLISLGGVGYSATGGTFILGRPNVASTATRLDSNLNGRTLALRNPSTQSGATALFLGVGAGRPPMVVNSSVRVTNLNADRLDGLHARDFARAKSEGWHYIGDQGKPPFENGWSNFDSKTHTTAEYQHAAYKIDSNGIVHIRGLIKGGNINQVFFTLPREYCPYFTKVFPVIANNQFARVTVNSRSHVASCRVFQNVGSPVWVSLEGVSFPHQDVDGIGAADPSSAGREPARRTSAARLP